MDAKELRIGNHVKAINRIEEIGVSTFQNLEDFIENDIYKPIPLTEEWLEKFGFERYSNQAYKSLKWTLDDTGFVSDWFYLKRTHINTNGIFTVEAFKFGSKLRRLDYVHQLQNLYFALTGEELEIKEKV